MRRRDMVPRRQHAATRRRRVDVPISGRRVRCHVRRRMVVTVATSTAVMVRQGRRRRRGHGRVAAGVCWCVPRRRQHRHRHRHRRTIRGSRPMCRRRWLVAATAMVAVAKLRSVGRAVASSSRHNRRRHDTAGAIPADRERRGRRLEPRRHIRVTAGRCASVVRVAVGVATRARCGVGVLPRVRSAVSSTLSRVAVAVAVAVARPRVVQQRRVASQRRPADVVRARSGAVLQQRHGADATDDVGEPRVVGEDVPELRHLAAERGVGRAAVLCDRELLHQLATLTVPGVTLPRQRRLHRLQMEGGGVRNHVTVSH